MQFPVDHAFAWTSWVFMAEGLGTLVSVREGQNSGRARPAPEDGRLDSYGTDCSTPLKGTPGCEPQGRRKFGCATRPGRPRAVETRHRLAPPCCRLQRPGSGCRRRNRRLNTRSSVWEKQEEETPALPPAPSPGRTALASPRPLRGPSDGILDVQLFCRVQGRGASPGANNPGSPGRAFGRERRCRRIPGCGSAQPAVDGRLAPARV